MSGVLGQSGIQPKAHMRAIIIEEERFAEICTLMRAEAARLATDSNTPARLGWDMNIWKAACDEIQHNMHYHFVRWAQSHGASCVPK